MHHIHIVSRANISLQLIGHLAYYIHLSTIYTALIFRIYRTFILPLSILLLFFPY